MTDMTPEAQKMHDLLHEQVGLELQPGLCENLATAILEGTVPEQHAEDRHQEGLYLAAEAYPLIIQARDIILHCTVWEGPETWKEDSVAALERIVHVLRPKANERTQQGDPLTTPTS